jgi:hypothetical protein
LALQAADDFLLLNAEMGWVGKREDVGELA